MRLATTVSRLSDAPMKVETTVSRFSDAPMKVETTVSRFSDTPMKVETTVSRFSDTPMKVETTVFRLSGTSEITFYPQNLFIETPEVKFCKCPTSDPCPLITNHYFSFRGNTKSPQKLPFRA